MTADAKQLFQDGALAAAIEAQLALVRQRPTDAAARALLIDLLCFMGDFERADKQLDLLVAQNVDLTVAAALSRQLARAGIARREVFEKGRAPELLSGATGFVPEALRGLLELRDGRTAQAGEAFAAAEAARVPRGGTCNGVRFDDLRDADDTCAGVLEVLTSTGKYYWVPLSEVASIEFRPPTLARDLLWRRALLDVRTGPDGEVFIPAIYPTPIPDGPDADSLRLGRETKWLETPGAPVRGLGLRLFLVGEEAQSIHELQTVTFDPPAEQAAAG
jgi:type VI secretion system protein ImpE